MMDIPKPDLSFVDVEDVRNVLEDYYHQTLKAEDTGCYLGVLVGCGSVAEGLLTWALFRREPEALKAKNACKDDKGTVKPLSDWNLANLILVSKELGVIGSTAERASWAVKDFRNFIHPYNVLKQSARPDEALAISALAAVAEIARSLQKRV